MPVEALRAVNGIGAKSRVPAGHTLLVPSQRPTPESEASLTSAVFTTVPQGRTFYYKVNRGDTLEGIAARFAVTTGDLRRWNDLGHRSLVAGQQLRITSDLAPNAARAKRASGGQGKVAPAKAVPAKKAAPAKPAAKPKAGTSSAKPAAKPSS
jgi:LysM repeat protein